MNIQNNISLKKYNSFKIDSIAKHFIEINNETELLELIKNYNFNSEKYFILGNGTNVLFASDFYDGLIIKNNIKHTLKLELINNEKNGDMLKNNILLSQKNILITASSGIDYDDLLKEYFTFLTKNDLTFFSGLENLSQIPTSVGAAVVQNVGAYSVEQNNFFYECSAINLLNGELKFFNKNESNFDYRNSFFKQNPNYFITEVKYIISLNDTPILNYADLNNIVSDNINPKNIYNDIAEIRKNKIPSHIDFPNCGSFFKNPIISEDTFNNIIKQHPNIVNYKNNNKIKLSAANLIEDCGLKGYRIGDVGISDKHSLFIINYGNATGKDIVSFAEFIVNKINIKYGIKLLPEVVIVN